MLGFAGWVSLEAGSEMEINMQDVYYKMHSRSTPVKGKEKKEEARQSREGCQAVMLSRWKP